MTRDEFKKLIAAHGEFCWSAGLAGLDSINDLEGDDSDAMEKNENAILSAFDALQAENARYKEALKKVRMSDGIHDMLNDIIEVAKEALNPIPEEE